MVDRSAIDDFLAQKRIAIIGASRDPKAFSNAIYRELKAHGYDVVPVSRSAETIEGDPCTREIADLPDGIDGAIVMVRADDAAGVVHECIDRGIPRVWLHKGVGPGSVSDDAVALCREHGIEVVDGACPLMFAEPVAWFHRLHRAELHITGRLASA